MSEKASSKSNFFGNIAEAIIKVLIVLLIFVIVVLPIYLMASAHPTPPEIQTIEAEVSRLWIEQVESDTGGFRTRRIELSQPQGEIFVCDLAPMARQVWGQLEIGETYQVAATWTGTKCYLHEATKLN
jgi:hypothetical protein